jgi:hypothetical protein
MRPSHERCNARSKPYPPAQGIRLTGQRMLQRMRWNLRSNRTLRVFSETLVLAPTDVKGLP